MEKPPFYLLTRRQHTITSTDEDGKVGEGAVGGAEGSSQPLTPQLDKGQIHTKRASVEDPSRLAAMANADVSVPFHHNL